jgi:hypothetical protein
VVADNTELLTGPHLPNLISEAPTSLSDVQFQHLGKMNSATHGAIEVSIINIHAGQTTFAHISKFLHIFSQLQRNFRELGKILTLFLSEWKLLLGFSAPQIFSDDVRRAPYLRLL